MRSEYLQQDLNSICQSIRELELDNSTVLITGATGFIGSLLVKSIIEYNENHHGHMGILAMARNPEKVKLVFAEEFKRYGVPEYLHFVYQDIAAPISIDEPCDYVIHTANSTTSKELITYPVEVLDSIYFGTREVLEFARRAQVKGLVYLSSMEVFGQVYHEERVNESELGYIPLNSVRSCYSEGKRAAELMCKLYAEEYGVPVKTARLSQTFGAGIAPTENRVFAQFARSAINGQDIELHTKGLSVGNYCYTADVIRALLLLLKKGNNGEAYTVVNEETTRTISDMAQMVAKEFSKGRSKVVYQISETAKYGYAPDTKLHLCAAKLRELGWEPRYTLKDMYSRMLPDLMDK